MEHKEQFETLPDGLCVKAPAKINLSLLIAGKRPDGFHEIETIMAKINFYDEILIQKGQKPGIEVICQGPLWAPQGQENLIYQAAQMLLEDCETQTDIKLTLTKNIPAGSGLGSASSDAAATLVGLKKFLNLQISHEKMAQIAAKLGSDVPFFLDGPLAFCSGKGEKIKKIEKKFDFLAILIIPDINISTKSVYDNYNHDKAHYEGLKTRIDEFLQKNRSDLVTNMCANMLQKSSFHLNKELAELKNKVESLNRGPLCLSGSGSTLFCLVQDGDGKKAQEYQRIIADEIGCKSIIVSNNRW